jgi:enterochelin esterase-like enzyme
MGYGVEMEDLEINALVTRLSRPHSSGGVVIERAAILAAGADSPAVIDWILAHSGTPDTTVTAARSRGLHGSRLNDGNAAATKKPLRFVLPVGTLS